MGHAWNAVLPRLALVPRGSRGSVEAELSLRALRPPVPPLSLVALISPRTARPHVALCVVPGGAGLQPSESAPSAASRSVAARTPVLRRELARFRVEHVLLAPIQL